MLIILMKPLTTKAYDRRASGDCGTSGIINSAVSAIKWYDRQNVNLSVDKTKYWTIPNKLLIKWNCK